MNHDAIAALAGVLHHLEETEDIEEARHTGHTNSAGLWALHGRQSIMRMRNLVQRRVLSR